MDLDQSNGFDVFIMFLSLSILLFIIVRGIVDIIQQSRLEGVRTLNKTTSVALMLCISSAISLSAGRIFQIYTKLSPPIYTIDTKGNKKFLGGDSTTQWTNNISVILAAICLLHLAQSWIEVSRSVTKMRKITDEQTVLKKIVWFLEGTLALGAPIL